MAATCYSLILGARNAPARGRRFSRADERLVRDITARHFPDGFTILNAGGGWFDPERRKFVTEESRQILVCPTRRRQLRGWCEELAVALRQKELLVMKVGEAVVFERRSARVRSRPGAAASRLEDSGI